MDFNSFVFPVPPKREMPERTKEHLIWVPVFENSLSKAREYKRPVVKSERLVRSVHTQSSPDLLNEKHATKPSKYEPFSARSGSSSGNQVPRVQMKHFTPLRISKGDLSAPMPSQTRNGEGRIAKRIFLSSTGDSKPETSVTFQSSVLAEQGESRFADLSGYKPVQSSKFYTEKPQALTQTTEGQTGPKTSFTQKMALFATRETTANPEKSSHKLLLSKIGNPLSRIRRDDQFSSASASNVTIKLQTKTIGPQVEKDPEANIKIKKSILDTMSQS